MPAFSVSTLIGLSVICTNLHAFSLRENCPNTEFFLVRIQENTDQKKICIWTLFMQCLFSYLFETSSTVTLLKRKQKLLSAFLIAAILGWFLYFSNALNVEMESLSTNGFVALNWVI